MLAKVHTAAVVGLEGEVVEVEVDTSRGLANNHGHKTKLAADPRTAAK